MKTTLILFLIIFTILLQSTSVYSNVETHLIVRTDNGESNNQLAIGIHQNATYWLDEHLGERDMPPPPPSRLYPVFSFMNQDSSYVITSFKDFQPLLTYSGESRTFSLRIYRESGTQVSFEWNVMDNRIDSAYLIDEASNGATIKLDMKKVSGGTGSLWLDRYKIIVWYNYLSNSVIDKFNDGEIEIFPNPVEDYTTIRCSGYDKKYFLTDVYGKIITTGITSNIETVINMKDLSSGVYLFKIIENGNIVTKKIIKK